MPDAHRDQRLLAVVADNALEAGGPVAPLLGALAVVFHLGEGDARGSPAVVESALVRLALALVLASDEVGGLRQGVSADEYHRQ